MDIEKELSKILSEDVEFYEKYMRHLSAMFLVDKSKDKAKVVELYHAAESAWISLVNLKRMHGQSGWNNDD